ncbi:hypothetical protein ANN_05617 [Periplaneta americana]|uniref:Uncharacterized protein n=1 Tax=Periplaneta americana TaxID=6978 RepID=A0ABQ8TBA8_PERAM|nr:hypothetical protein ANN_05617 [Periplaneta americana]
MSDSYPYSSYKNYLQKARVCLCGGERHWKGKGDREEYSVDKEARKAPYMTHWSPDKRTYVAAKALPGAGALIYMAVAKDPSQGWDIPKR